MSRYSCILCCLVAVLATAGLGQAAWPEEKGEAEKGGPGLVLTLDAVVREVIRSNPLVEEARLQWLISSRQAKAAWGDFEPELVLNYERNGFKRENTTLQMLQQKLNTEYSEENEEYGAGLEGKFLTGGTYRIGLSVSKMDNNLATGSEYQSFIGVSGEQPLLKGASHGAPLAAVRAAEREKTKAFHGYRGQLMKVIFQTESVYWSLAFAQEKHRLAAESVEIARNLVRDSRQRFEAGKMSELDLLEAEAGLAIRLAQRADSEQEVLEAMTQLKLLIAQDRLGYDRLVIAVDPLLPPSPDGSENQNQVDRALEWALSAQPDYLMRREELAKEKIILGYQKDRRLPELNLKASYGLNGMGNTAQESLGKFEGFTFPAWSFGVEMRIPTFFGIRERNELAATYLRNKLADIRLKAAESEILHSIAGLRQRLVTLRGRIENARTVVEYKHRLLDVELLRLDAGKSDIRRVYEVEEELAEARRMELDSIVNYREAEMQLSLVQGSVLRDKGLEYMQDNRIRFSERIPAERG